VPGPSKPETEADLAIEIEGVWLAGMVTARGVGDRAARRGLAAGRAGVGDRTGVHVGLGGGVVVAVQSSLAPGRGWNWRR